MEALKKQATLSFRKKGPPSSVSDSTPILGGRPRRRGEACALPGSPSLATSGPHSHHALGLRVPSALGECFFRLTQQHLHRHHPLPTGKQCRPSKHPRPSGSQRGAWDDAREAEEPSPGPLHASFSPVRENTGPRSFLMVKATLAVKD